MQKTLWLLGEASGKTRRELAERNWILQDLNSNKQLARIYALGLVAKD